MSLPNHNVSFQEFASWVRRSTGIVLTPDKRAMVEARLKRQRDASGIRALEDYLGHLVHRAGPGERRAVLDALTTNTTSFYRESHHFELLGRCVVPTWKRLRFEEPFRAWSAACSTGEEAFSIAFELQRLQHGGAVGNYKVLATDISHEVLSFAKRACYPLGKVRGMEEEKRSFGFTKSFSEHKAVVEVRPEIRKQVSFHHLNLVSEDWKLKPKFDVIFCRNVLIYFDDNTRREVVGRLVQQLAPSGFLVLGHSDNALTRDLPVTSVGPTAYQLREAHRKVA